MRRRRESSIVGRLRGCAAALVLAGAVAWSAPALAALLPRGYFDNIPVASGDQVIINADSMFYDRNSGRVTATGNVQLSYQGYKASADSLYYDTKSGDVALDGHVSAVDPDGQEYTAAHANVTGDYKNAFLRALSIRTPQGALITADQVDFAKAIATNLKNATYSPCGKCVDDKGRKIGWRVYGLRINVNKKTHIVYVEQPRLELLGYPIAWLPALWFPDPTEKNNLPIGQVQFGYNSQYGAKLGVPLFVPTDGIGELAFTPTLFSKQGLMLGLDWNQKIGALKYRISGSAIYQLDPEAYAGTVGDKRWRGAIQTSGTFVPTREWTLGWSYTAFSDPAYLKDYDYTSGDYATNEVYAEHVGRNTYANVRVQEFKRLGNVSRASQDTQGSTLPNARGDAVFDLAHDAGRIAVRGSLLGIRRERDDVSHLSGVTPGGVTYVHGYEGDKLHGMAEADWSKQFVSSVGVLFTPYLGLRLDAASYDGASSRPTAPPESTRFTATPVAAIDTRFPLMARTNGATHIIEPIAQLVYRGASTSSVGITNDDAQSLVLEDSNLFSYNRFSGSDRQETGLRANVGAQYSAQFDDGSWYDVTLGESFHLAGANAFAATDDAKVNPASGLSNGASYIVAGARGSFAPGVTFGGKVEVNPSGLDLARAIAATNYANAGYSFGVSYRYRAADASLGVPEDQQEVGISGGIPLYDYVRATGAVDWDIAGQSWLRLRAGLAYDDGYLSMGVNYIATGPTNDTPNDHKILASIYLKGPDHQPIGGIGY